VLFVAEKPVGRTELSRGVGGTPRQIDAAIAELAAAAGVPPAGARRRGTPSRPAQRRRAART
jgi:hypothetical protein